jgi:hypothetical protein
MENNPSQESVTDGVDVTPAEGLENVSPAVKDVLSEALGRKFTSDEDALKSVKDTYDYVGKAGKYHKAVESVAKARGVSEDEAVKIIMESSSQNPETQVPPAIDDSKFISRQEFEEKQFYAEKKEYVPFKEIISALGAQTGKSPAEVVELDTFKTVYGKAQAADEFEKSKSVLSTNPRLGSAQDKISTAREALRDGSVAVAEANAVDAVREAFEL